MKALSKKVERKLVSVAKGLGISREEALQEAVLSYYARAGYGGLRSELIAWDDASAADFAVFEKNYDPAEKYQRQIDILQSS